MPASEPKKLPGIFISYRRSDTPDAVGRIYDRLVSEFGKTRVFKDVDSIPLGQDFRSHLNDIVGGCAAVLAIVGPRWVDTRNASGQRRLEDPDDFVRIELESALARNVPVVPVLVGHAPMPGSSELPTSLASMAFRQSIEVRPDPDFHNDATRLVSALRLIIDPNAPVPASTASAARTSSFGWMWPTLFAVAALAAVALAVPALRYLRQVPQQETRIAISLPVVEGSGTFALSPDGRQVVYGAKGDPESRLWLHSVATMTTQPLPGTGGALAPFWSPDGRSIAFFARGALKRLDLGSAQPQTLATVGNSPTGAWGVNGDIVFNPEQVGGIVRIAATGGPTSRVTMVDAQTAALRVHSFLPDGEHFIYSALGGKEPGTYLGAVDGSPGVRLTGEVGPGAYLPSGWFLLLRLGQDPSNSSSGALVAQRLDVRNARLTGEPVTISGEVAAVSASNAGLIAYLTSRGSGRRQLTWLNRSGDELGTIGDVNGTLSSPRVAPDGRRVAVSQAVQGNRDIWLLDGTRSTRMTFHESEDAYPVWSPDGSRIAFTSNRNGAFTLFEKLASGAGVEKSLKTADDQGAYPSGWSADGQYLLYFAVVAKNAVDIRMLRLTGGDKPIEIANTPFVEVWGQYSPDGKWIAYQSDESGKYEIFVRTFPPNGAAGSVDSSAATQQGMMSTSGGTSPMWSADGKELYYINPAGEMMATPFTVNGSAFVPGSPVKLFDAHVWGGGSDNATGRQYDVAADGRFLINREVAADATPTLTLIQNWNPDAKN